MVVTRVHQREIVEVPFDNAWLNKPLSKQSYFITHIVKDFNTDDVINRYNNYVKQSAFFNIVQKIVRNVTSLSLQPNEK